jgi:surface antigen
MRGLRGMAMIGVVAVMVAGCMEGVKERIGTVAGGVGGAVVGGSICGWKCALAGGVLGGVVGNRVGASLDEKDKAALQASTIRALESSPDGHTSSWNSDHSEAAATMTVTETKKEARPVKLVRDKRVPMSDSLVLIGKEYESTTRANVRRAPDKTSEAVGGLIAGESFTAVAKTSNNWILVGKNGVAVGYVYGELVKERSTSSDGMNTKLRAPTDLDAITVADGDVELGGVNLDNVETEITTVQAETKCRTMQSKLKTKDGESDETFSACKAGDGAWEII